MKKIPLDNGKEIGYTKTMKRTIKTQFLALLLAITACLGGCTLQLDKAFCNHENKTVVIPATCAQQGFTAEECTKCGYIQNERDFVPKWSAHEGIGACRGCNVLFAIMLAEDLKTDGQEQADGYVWQQGIMDGEHLTLRREKANEKVHLTYVKDGETIVIHLSAADAKYDCEYTSTGGAPIKETLDAQAISAVLTENTFIENLALRAAQALERTYFSGKKYSMKNFGFTSI